MSPRKLTEDDKQEILQLYRNSEATTSTLANDYEVSSSTISRFLKNKLSSAEYEDLIQQKRLARTPRGEKSSAKSKSASTKKTKKTKKTKTKSPSEPKPVKTKKVVAVEEEKTPPVEAVTAESETESKSEILSEPKSTNRRRRRRSAAAEETTNAEASTPALVANEPEEVVEEKQPSKLVIDKQPGGTAKVTANDTEDFEELAASKSNSLILKTNRVELKNDEDDDDDDDNEVDLIALKEMLGDDLEDFNDEDDDDDEDWDDDNDDNVTYSTKGSSLSDLEILPLSQASLPKICYLVIDRSAELIVKPLADFADLGDIPQEEIRQRTLPIFDNHRIAKRFSHRRERVIKVPDGRMIQKTSHHLQDKGITRLLIDGQIYSLSH